MFCLGLVLGLETQVGSRGSIEEVWGQAPAYRSVVLPI